MQITLLNLRVFDACYSVIPSQNMCSLMHILITTIGMVELNTPRYLIPKIIIFNLEEHIWGC